MLERYAICVKLSAEKKQCQLIYIDDPLALECRPIPKAIEQNINIGCWLKVQFNPDGNRKTWELTEDGPFLTSITPEGKFLITIPIFFPPCLSSLAPYLNIPDYKIGTWYFHALLAGNDQIQGEWKPNRKVTINHIYKGKFEIELQDDEGTPKWTLHEIQDQWDSLKGPISPKSALFPNGTCQQGPILKINGHLAVILGENEKLVYAELEEPNECAVGDFIEYKQMSITFNGLSVPIGIKCNGQHCQLDSCRKNLLKKISSKKDYFRISLDAANWGQLFEPVSNRIKGIGPLTCLPQHSSQLCSPKTLPIFIKVQALFYYEFHTVLWTILEIIDKEQIEEAYTLRKSAEKVPEDIGRGSNVTGLDKVPPSLAVKPIRSSSSTMSIARPKISTPPEPPKKCEKSADHPIDVVQQDCPHFFQHGREQETCDNGMEAVKKSFENNNATGLNKVPSLNIGLEQLDLQAPKTSSSSDELPKKCEKSANHCPIDAVQDCPHFFQHGWCAYKDNCKFSHGPAKETRGNGVEAVKKSVENNSTMSISRPKHSTPPELRKYIDDCPYFPRGVCWKKNICKFSHGSEEETRGYKQAVKKLAEIKTRASSTASSRAPSLDGLDNWTIGKYVVFLCKKGDEAILVEFNYKLVPSLFEIKAASMPRDVDVGDCVQMDYKISARYNNSVRRTLTAIRNVKKMDDQFIRTRVVVGGWAEIFTEFYECTDSVKNQYRTSRGLVFLPNAVTVNVNTQSGGHLFWCRFSEMHPGKVTHYEKIVPPVALAHPNAFTKDEMGILYEKASNHFGDKMIEIEVLYRCKFVEYFHKTIFNDMLMAGYTKNGSGHQGCPINKVLDGLFFSTFQPEPGKLPNISPFGNIRLRLAIGHLLPQPDAINLYFADFYCNKLVGTQKHNIVLVLCRKGTEEDEFCANHLILLQIWANPFLIAFRRENDAVVRFKVASNGADKINIYLAGSLKLPNYYSMICCYIEAIIPSGDGTSSICGLQHNDECTICNIDKKNNSNMLPALSIANKFRQKYVWKLQCN